MNWLINKNIFTESSIDNLIDILNSKNIPYDYIHYYDVITGKFDPPKMQYFPLVTINLIRRLKSDPNALIWCDFDKLKCSYYYGLVGYDLMVNGKKTMYTNIRNLSKPYHVNKLYDYRDVMFIRPDGNDKSFEGQKVHRDKLNNFLDYILQYNSPDIDVLVCQSRIIDKEWRFVVTDQGAVITGSQYETMGKFNPKPGYPDEAAYLAGIIGEKLHIHPVFVVDICYCEGEYKVMEIGSINCAGLYACEIEKLVDYLENTEL